ncbi:MAG: hypothetical protein M0009_11615 [Deltaproteobacteria bacterium]|nr:hypothetical protein [Deltaproteobacteria bacterium]
MLATPLQGSSGTPDIVLRKYHAVVFVHGCFWHRHNGCAFAFTPKISHSYWMPKFNRTVLRDRENILALEKPGVACFCHLAM